MVEFLQVDVREDVDECDERGEVGLARAADALAVEHVARRQQPQEHRHPVQTCTQHTAGLKFLPQTPSIEHEFNSALFAATHIKVSSTKHHMVEMTISPVESYT